MANAAAFAKPSLDVVRQLTDRHVVAQLMEHEASTRADIATRTGISKPTVSESIRRLGAAGTVVAAGAKVGGRGRSGTNYRLVDDIGVAVAVHLGPEGALVEVINPQGRIVYNGETPIEQPCTPRRLTAIVKRVLAAAASAVPTAVRAVSVSIADPVDQRTDNVVALPNSPFLVGELKPYALLQRLGYRREITLVDNDTNFAALAEHRLGSGRDLHDFGLLWLGAGIGLGLVLRGSRYRGWSGMAGEIWQTSTTIQGTSSLPLHESIALLGLASRGSAGIDVEKVCALLNSGTAAARRSRDALADAVSLAVANAISLLNPQAVVVAGPWAECGDFRVLLADRLARAPIGAAIRASTIVGNPFLIGARIDALDRLRASILEGVS